MSSSSSNDPSLGGRRKSQRIMKQTHAEPVSSLKSAMVETKQTKIITTKQQKELPNNDISIANNIDGFKLLEDWITHNDAKFHHFDPNEAAQIRQALLSWYRQNRRRLPWRGDAPPYDGSTAAPPNNKGSKNSTATAAKATTAAAARHYNQNAKQIPQSAYGIWVSEIMLQQTRVEAVIPYYLKWMESFPTVKDLADATDEQVNSHWAGLGFYRRARLLHQAAKHVQEKYNGQLPNTVEELQGIPGIGRYTASAIASIAFDVCVPVVDGNVCRVLSRLRGIAQHIKAPILKDKLGWALAEQIVKAGDGTCAGEVNQAIMELGATYCAPSGTGIDPDDPLKNYYMSTQIGAAYYRLAIQMPTKHCKRIHDLVEKAQMERCQCALCEDNGISTVLEQLATYVDAELETTDGDKCDAARRIGHSGLPIAPPKQSKREECLAVAVICTVAEKKEDARWLLMKRPNKGLLAGQWEFPATCLWNSDSDDKIGTNGKKRKAASDTPDNEIQVPQIPVSTRNKALTELLGEIFCGDETTLKKINCSEMKKLKRAPLEHIFSHVRHTMWVDYSSLDVSKNPLKSKWTSATDREVRWMREADMKQAGITSGVRKILKAVKEEQASGEKKRSFFQPRKKK